MIDDTTLVAYDSDGTTQIQVRLRPMIIETQQSYYTDAGRHMQNYYRRVVRLTYLLFTLAPPAIQSQIQHTIYKSKSVARSTAKYIKQRLITLQYASSVVPACQWFSGQHLTS